MQILTQLTATVQNTSVSVLLLKRNTSYGVLEVNTTEPFACVETNLKIFRKIAGQVIFSFFSRIFVGCFGNLCIKT